MDKRAMISELSTKRAEVRKGLDAVLEQASAESRGLTDEERARFDADEAEVRTIDARVKELDEQIRADAAAAEVAKRYAFGGAKVVSEPDVYRRGYGGRSYFRDLHLARNKGDRDAFDRLTRNDRMVAEQRGITTVAGAGGEFVPPLWLETQFVKLARPGRVTANLAPTQALPPGTDSINIPKVSTGTTVASQATQNNAVSNTDLATTSVSSPVVTIAGGQTISLQLLEQSPLNIDEVVLGDLAAAYATQLNTQVLSGLGTGGTLTGVLTQSGTNAVTYTSASPTVPLLYPKVADAIQRIHTARYLPPDTIIMHPRRWAYLLAATDATTGRPLVTPKAGGMFQNFAVQDAVEAQGYVGEMQGLPVFVDACVPTNLGAGTNQDPIIVARIADLMLWEGNVKAEAFQQTYAQNLSVYVRLYNYASFQPGRYPASISVISGTGLVAPTF
jgi:HK97 family phage major capsid protein